MGTARNGAEGHSLHVGVCVAPPLIFPSLRCCTFCLLTLPCDMRTSKKQTKTKQSPQQLAQFYGNLLPLLWCDYGICTMTESVMASPKSKHILDFAWTSIHKAQKTPFDQFPAPKPILTISPQQNSFLPFSCIKSSVYFFPALAGYAHGAVACA